MSQSSPSSKHRLGELRQLPLEPSEYCRRWIAAEPGKGYLKVAINALAEATGLSPGTIKNWGPDFRRRPQYALRLLIQADLLNQIQQLDELGEISIREDALQD